MPFQVKRRIAALLALLIPAAAAEPAPDAAEILRGVRDAYRSQAAGEFSGRLRTGNRTLPFTLSLGGGSVAYRFSDPPQTLALELGEKGASLRESTPGGERPVAPGRFETPLRGTDITYGDLSLRFIYWVDARVIGEALFNTRPCWHLELRAPDADRTQYGRVEAWIDRRSGALMKAEGYDPENRLATRFKVISGRQLPSGEWMLKQMRIERFRNGRPTDPEPTYLELDPPK